MPRHVQERPKAVVDARTGVEARVGAARYGMEVKGGFYLIKPSDVALPAPWQLIVCTSGFAA